MTPKMIVTDKRASCYVYLFAICLGLLALIKIYLRKANDQGGDSNLRSPANISCLYSEFKTMTCTWSLEDYYVNDYNTHLDIEENVHIYYTFNVSCSQYCYRDIQLYLQCVCLEFGKTKCSWSHKSSEASESLSLHVTVRDGLTSTPLLSGRKKIELLDIVKPSPVNNLAVENSTKDGCLLVIWDNFESYTDYICELTTSSKCQKKMTRRFLYLHERPIQVSPKICNLHPYDITILEVRCRVMVMQMERGFWSNLSILPIEIGYKVPYRFPETTEGLYEAIGGLQDGLIPIRLYFTPMKDCDLHDDPDNVLYCITVKENNTICTFHPKFFIETVVPDGNLTNIMLFALNSAGPSKQMKNITIFPEDQAPTPSHAEITDIGFTRLIDVATDETVKHTYHTFVTCNSSKNELFSCGEPVKWYNMNNSQRLFNTNGYDMFVRYGLITHVYNEAQPHVISTSIHWFEFNERHIPHIYTYLSESKDLQLQYKTLSDKITTGFSRFLHLANYIVWVGWWCVCKVVFIIFLM